MVALYGTVSRHFYCLNHAERLGLNLPKLGVVRLKLSALRFTSTVFNCEYSSVNDNTVNVPFVDFCYELEAASLLREVVVGDKLEIEARNSSFYYLSGKLSTIKETENKLVKYWNLQFRDGEDWDLSARSKRVSLVNRLTNLNVKGDRQVTLSTEQVLRKLVKLPTVPTLGMLELPKPVIKVSQPQEVSLELVVS